MSVAPLWVREPLTAGRLLNLSSNQSSRPRYRVRPSRDTWGRRTLPVIGSRLPRIAPSATPTWCRSG